MRCALSHEANTHGAPLVPTTAGKIARLILPMSLARRKDRLAAAAFEQQACYSQLRVQNVDPHAEIHLALAGEDSGKAIPAQAR